MSATDTIRIDHLCKTYTPTKGSQIHAVRDINLVVPQGCIFGFLGPNGAGKTTTIKMICGLVRPTSGCAAVNGMDVWHRRSDAMRQIGAVLEGTRNVHWTLSAWDNLLYFGHLKGMYGKELSARAGQLLKEMALWDRRHDLVRVFSRGMQQKVAVACALVADPPIILLDEPTLGLDVQAARIVKQLVVHLARDLKKTVVLTTHQLDMAQDVCDRVAIIIRGEIVTDRAMADLLNLFRQEYYEIKVSGAPSSALANCFDGMTASEKDGAIMLTGPVADAQHLYNLIEQMRALQLNLLSINRSEPNLEEIFIQLVDRHMRQSEAQS